MRIQHNIAAMNSYRQLGGNNSRLSKNLEKLSSGYRVNRAGDDAAGLAISEKMRGQIAGLSAAKKNANDGISYIQTAEGALGEIHSMLTRMSELTVQASNGIYAATERTKIKSELESLVAEMDRIADDTKFNGITVFGKNAAATNAEFVVSDAGSKIKLLGADMNLDLKNKKMESAEMKVDTTANALLTKGNVDAMIEHVSTIRSNLGALQNRLEHTIESLGTSIENTQAAEARIRDTDMADEMMSYTKNNILVQSAQAMLAQANQVPQGVLQLLQ